MAVDDEACALRRSHFAACVLYTMNSVIFIIVVSLQPVQGYPACVSTYTRTAGVTTHCAYPPPSPVSAGFLVTLAVCHGVLALWASDHTARRDPASDHTARRDATRGHGLLRLCR